MNTVVKWDNRNRVDRSINVPFESEISDDPKKLTFESPVPHSIISQSLTYEIWIWVMAKGQSDNFEQSYENRSKDMKSEDPAIWPFVVPFVAYMLIASRAPALTHESIDDVSVSWYFYLVVTQVIVTIGLVLYWMRRYLTEFPFKIDIWGFVVGVIGVVIWVALCGLQIERQTFDFIGLGDWFPERTGFNPFDQISSASRRYSFLFFRFTMLALMVPIIEELFLRGFLLRYLGENPNWQQTRLSDLGTNAIWAAVIYGVLTHPGEAIAAAAWFGLVTVLMLRTGKFWNCVVAHAVTNLLLGFYVIYSGAWHLW